MPGTFRFRSLGPLLAALFVSVGVAKGQSISKPYAAIDRNAVNYAGPGRETGHDLTGPVVKIGLLVPQAGPRKSEGQALLEAAQMALEDEASNPFAKDRKLALVMGDESGPWGRVSSEVVRLIYEEEAVALITSAEGGSAHLAEQVGNKIGVPIVTLSTDDTTTQINLPWIFRLGPSDTAQAKLFAEDIYRHHRLGKVVLVVEDDHDGRVGGEEFAKAAKELPAPGAPSPAFTRFVVRPSPGAVDGFLREVLPQNPEAIVLWTGADVAATLLPALRQEAPGTRVYLCRKAAQGLAGLSSPGQCTNCSNPEVRNLRSDSEAGRDSPNTRQGGVWIVASSSEEDSRQAAFDRRYMERTGGSPTLAARQSYDAVRIIAKALRQSGANRVRLRDALAEISNYAGASGLISFDHAGNDLAPTSLVRLSDERR
ncbi:MAG TPA: ABC transporter substrate-binding protein [Terriglobia bacterium]|nr:ABC transporter substrate-binding protein [Terriglobia bacterium]